MTIFTNKLAKASVSQTLNSRSVLRSAMKNLTCRSASPSPRLPIKVFCDLCQSTLLYIVVTLLERDKFLVG
jgi:hypothetical protein